MLVAKLDLLFFSLAADGQRWQEIRRFRIMDRSTRFHCPRFNWLLGAWTLFGCGASNKKKRENTGPSIRRMGGNGRNLFSMKKKSAAMVTTAFRQFYYLAKTHDLILNWSIASTTTYEFLMPRDSTCLENYSPWVRILLGLFSHEQFCN